MKKIFIALLLALAACSKKGANEGDTQPPTVPSENHNSQICGLKPSQSQDTQADPMVTESYHMAVQSDGKIIRTQQVGSVSQNNNVFEVARYDADGSLDASFAQNGVLQIQFLAGFGATASSVAIQADGKILVAGTTTTYWKSLPYGWYEISETSAVARLNSDGSFDNTFSDDGRFILSNYQFFGSTRIHIQTDNRILIAMAATDALPFIATRLDTNGQLDLSYGKAGVMMVRSLHGLPQNDYEFNPILSFYPYRAISALQIDDKLLLGKFVAYGPNRNYPNFAFSVLRFNTDGSLDTSWANGGELHLELGNSYNDSTDMIVQHDNKILISTFYGAGTKLPYNPGVSEVFSGGVTLHRFFQNGHPDLAFGPNGKITYAWGNGLQVTYSGNLHGVYNGTSLAQAPNGKIFIGYGRQINLDGSPNLSFQPISIDGCGAGAYVINQLIPINNEEVFVNGKSIARLKKGRIDRTFGVNGFATAQTSLPEGNVTSVVVPPVFNETRSGHILTTDRPQDPYLNENLNLMRANEAWKITTDCKNTPIAVIDTGVDTQHPDLSGQLLQGWNFIENNNNVIPDLFDGNRVDADTERGTMMAGFIGAVGNNGIGSAGICWRASILPLKVFSRNASGFLNKAAQGIRYAVDQGAKIILLAWSVEYYFQDLKNALQYAANKNVLVVVTGGNFYPFNPFSIDASLISPYPVNNYPAAFDLPNLVKAVPLDMMHTDLNNKNRSYNTGNADIAAPASYATGLYPTQPHVFGWHCEDYPNGYCNSNGALEENEAKAAAYVAGAAALYWNLHPELTALQVKEHMLQTVSARTFAKGQVRSGGVLNLQNLLSQ